MVWLWIFLSVTLGAIGQILMKEGMKAAGPVPLSDGMYAFAFYLFRAVLSIQLVSAAICYGLSFVLWLMVLSVADLTLARPLMSFGYIITLVYGYYAGEGITPGRVVGTLLVMAGLILVARSGLEK